MDSPALTARTDSLPRSRVLELLFHPATCLALLILATLVARYGVLSTPVGRVRATLTAMITRNLSRDLEEIGPKAFFYPRVDYAGDQPGYLLQELPLVNLAGVVLEKTLELPLETTYRLPSLVLFPVMLWFLFAFVRARFGTAEAIACILLISYLPVVVYQSVEVMPEQGVLTAFVAGLWFFDRYLDAGRAGHLAASAACFCLMLLIKSTSGLLLLVPVGLFRLRRGTLRGLLRPAHLVAGAACALPLVVWLVHATKVNRTSVVDDGRTMSELIGNYLDQKERWTMLARGKTYTGSWEMLSSAFESWVLFLFAAGCAWALSRRGKQRALFACWVASFLLFFAVLPFNISSHWYYTHGYAPLVALGAAVPIGLLVRGGSALLPPASRRPAQVLATVAALFLVLQARWDFVPPYDEKRLEFGHALASVVAPRALGIISSDDTGVWDGELFWASDTRGWRGSVRRVSRRPISEEFVADKRRRGAEFLAHYGPPEDLAERLPELYRRLSERNAVLASSPDWIVFSLKE